jgi:hypothetical protein
VWPADRRASLEAIFTGSAGDAWSLAAIVARLCRNATVDDFRIGEGADHDTCKELCSIHRGSNGRFAFDFNAGGFSVGANHMHGTNSSTTKSIECGAPAGLFDHSRGQLLEFSHGDDFSG